MTRNVLISKNEHEVLAFIEYSVSCKNR